MDNSLSVRHTPNEPYLPALSGLTSNLHQIIGLWNSLQRRLAGRPSSAITITSVNPGEGVSTITRDLAIVAAESSGAKVLIVDATPQQQHFTHAGLRLAPIGLDQLVLNQARLREAVVPVPGRRVWLSTLADGARISGLGLNPDVMGRVMSTLRERFNLILIDAPPISRSVATGMIASIADGTILVCEADKTRMPAIRSARRALEGNGAEVLGLVLNKRRLHVPQAVYDRL